ncbi:site-specific integrase [Pedobacter sp. CG_S7]|uniref:site-specific integrase n=1 Tax=Pedobacter sp. CG_S7 TaxID=3143930 RepID=UPI0033976651
MKALNNTFGVTFYLRRYKINNDGTIPIYMRITVNGKRLDISVKRTIADKNWNAGKGMAKGSREEIVKLNNYLEKFRSSIVECYQELHLQKKLITVEIIKEKIFGNDQQDYTLCKLISYHNTGQIGILATGTLKNYYTTERYIHKFLKEQYKTTDKYLTELSYSFILNFERYLRNHKPSDHHRPLNNNGIMKHIERFRKIVSLGVTLEWLEKDPFTKYKQKFDRVERQCLNIQELKRIEEKKFDIERLQQVKDLFIFSCYTGLSYIDVMNLQPGSVMIGLDGRDWIITSRQKTSTGVRIPLLEKAREIIEKYKTHPKIVADGSLLPRLSNQRLNGYLKEIADLCGITKPLTFHIARHTFATTITLNNGVPMESVSKMLGHTKLSTTQVYAKVIEQKLSDDMFSLSEKLLAIETQN